MKRIALLLVCGALVASAQEVRISRTAVLRAERSIISLRAGTIVDVLSRDQWTLTVRFNNYTGVLPASCLVPDGAANLMENGFGDSARKTVSPFGIATKKTKESGHNSVQIKPKKGDVLLAVN